MEKNHLEFLSNFKKANDGMIAINSTAYNNTFSNRRTRERLKDYTLEEIETIINSGSISEQQRLSRNYFYKDGFYRRILIYYATLLKYYGILIPHTADSKSLKNTTIQKRYNKAVDYIDKMNLPNLLTNCAIKALVNGTYYGVIVEETKDSFTILDLPSYYCCTRFKDFYGNNIIEFDLRYFDSILLENDRKKALDVYPKYISREYNKYHTGKRKSPWLFLTTDSSICFEFFDSRPLFLNVVPAAIRYDEAVETERERDLDEIKKIIVQKIPHNTNNEFLLGYSHNDYQFPGGHVEKGENLVQTIKREIKEETGIVLNHLNINPFAKMISYYKDWPEKGKNRKIEIYYYELKTDEKPNLNNTSYTESEKDGNFELRYIPVNDVEEELKENVQKYGDKKGITKEMLEILNLYKSLN